IRNFAIVAHVDHGKSTLADRFLEITNTVPKEKLKEQFLDQNPISRERGITIKLAPVRMEYKGYTLNLIDTPGHMDFSYEVSRTLAACEGAILLVDATSGVQAQTVAHFNAAKSENLKIIPAINKIDLESANIEKTEKELTEFFGFSKDEIYYVSAKTGKNVEELLLAIITKLPYPKGDEEKPLRALIFDAVFDLHRGVIAFVRVVDGKMRKGEKVRFLSSNLKTEASETGYFSPFLVPKEELSTGEIGYVVTGIKDIRLCRVGDTIATENDTVSQLPGYSTPKPLVFFGVYPRDQKDLVHLKEALNKLSLNDASLSISSEQSAFLGTGFKVGFLGLLHADIVRERLIQEGGIEPVLTMPRVLYEKENGEILEPYMNLIVYVPSQYLGSVMTLCQQKKGILKNVEYHDKNAVLIYEMPYSMFIRGLSSELKTVSSGFSSIDYEITDYRKADLVNLEIAINETPIDVLSELVYKDESYQDAKEKTEKLKEVLPRKQFRQVIQAKVGGKILSRSEIPPFRKDVLAKMSGGDRTRKDKLLQKQRKGKTRMNTFGRVDLPPQALFSLISDLKS
ncbi:MAG: elongation factor 4, partial [Candidatus Levybacteria bacterium RBG_16_35_6]